MPERTQPDKLVAWSEKQVNAMKRRVKRQVGEETIRRLEDKAKERDQDGDEHVVADSSQGYHSNFVPNGNGIPTTNSGGGSRSTRRQGIVHPAREGRGDLIAR